MIARRWPRTALCMTTVLLSLAGPAPSQELERAEWEQALDQYKEFQRRLPFLWHTWGRQRFARTQDPRARDILIQSYAKPSKPEEFVRYLLASIVTDSFQDEDSVEALADWRKRFKKKEDAWSPTAPRSGPRRSGQRQRP